MARNYSNVAEETALSTGINSSDTSITVGSNTGYPSVPYTILIDPGLATEEVCEVTAVVGTTWTITRGVDGTAASSHDSGAVVVHGYSARDLRDIQDHIADSTGVHGLASSSSVVGTTDTQTLANKTLTAPTINGGTLNSVTLGAGLTLSSPVLITPTIASFVNATHDHSDAASGGEIDGGGGGSTTGLAYRRSRDTADPVSISAGGDAGAIAVSFPDLDYNVGGNTTWAVNGSNNRITLPTDITNGVWHVSASAKVTANDGEFDSPFLNIVHQDHGILATDGTLESFGSGTSRRFSVSSDFQAASAGRWVEVRLGTDGATPTEFDVDYASISIHRVA
jgi:uncharacterized membrane protein